MSNPVWVDNRMKFYLCGAQSVLRHTASPGKLQILLDAFDNLDEPH